MEEPTNGELAIMISGLKELFELRFDQNDQTHATVNLHLKKLNGQVAKNTAFRYKWAGVFTAIGILGTLGGVVTVLINASKNL